MPPDQAPPPAVADLTPAQLGQIQRMNRDINWHFSQVRDGATSGPRGACQWNAQMKAWALQGMGIPPAAVSFRDYPARGLSDPYHRVLDVRVRVNGRPQTITLDMNDPWLRHGQP